MKTCRMSEVEQVIPDMGPELSGEDSVVGPVIIERTPTDILNSVPENVKCFIGTADKMTIDEWLGYTTQWMSFIRIPQEYWVDVAATLLREKALTFWTAITTRREVHEWSIFKSIMTHNFMKGSKEKVWYRRLSRFHQRFGESAQEYTDRFNSEIVMSCFRNMSDREKRDVYANGLFKWFKVSELMEKHKTFDELKAAVLIFDEQPEGNPEKDPKDGMEEDSEENLEEDPEENPEDPKEEEYSEDDSDPNED